jgi:hypothetical protein
VKSRARDAGLRPGCLFTLGDCPTPYLAVDVEAMNNSSTLAPTYKITLCSSAGYLMLYHSDWVEVIGEAG